MVESETIRLTNDVLMEVLALLPPESVLRCKSVSPEWRDLLSSPAFLQRHAAAHRRSDNLIAFFQEVAVHEASETVEAKHCNSLPICEKFQNLNNVPRHVDRFVNSSNGLILCSCMRGSAITYHVGNPLTGKFLELPLPPYGKRCLVSDFVWNDKYRLHHGLITPRQPSLHSAVWICEGNNNNDSPAYSVVRVGKNRYCGEEKATILYTDSYSSMTGEWSTLNELVAPRSFHLSDQPPVVANSVVHWYTDTRDIVVYNPMGGDQHLQLIKVPYSCKKDNNTDCCAVTRSVDDDVLWLGLMHRHNLMFYMLPKLHGGNKSLVDVKEWVLMHEASIFSISRLMKKGLVACKGPTYIRVFDSRIEIGGGVRSARQEEKVFLYNVQRNSIVKVDYSGCYNKKLRLSPYLQSSSLSTYRL